MRIIAFLIALAGAAGLVALLAPIDGASILPLLLEHEPLRGIVMAGGFAIGLGLGGFAVAKERMARLHSVATLVGFAAAGVVMEIWNWIEIITKGANLPGSMAIASAAVVLGVIMSIAGMIKGRADY